MTSIRLRQVPWLIVICISALIATGLSGIARGDELAGSSQFYGKQLIWVGVAATVLLVVNLFINYRILAHYSFAIFCVSVCLLCVVFLFRPINGARRWIPLGFMSFQPSEVTKLAYIIALASYLRFRENYRQMSGLAAPFAMTLLPMALIYKEPNLGTCLLFLPVLFAMLFTAGARPRHLIAVILLGVCLTPVLWLGMSREQRSRVSAMVLQSDGGPAEHDDGAHLHSSKRVIALGQFWGSELGQPLVEDAAAYHVPEARTDFVFCMIAERWGFVGCCVTLCLYATLYARGLMIAAAPRDPFGRLLAVGIVTLFATQTIINTAMTVGLMPITGITLPLLSYGGSSLATTCLALGLLINVGIHRGYEMRGQPFRFATG
jgi:cell division protein FtsW (lipid II flippase)